MKPWTTLSRQPAPGGGELVLQERGGEYVIRVDGHELMSSRAHGSEEALATTGCAGLGSRARVLVGGLGMGYTLRAALAGLASTARVVVAELSPAVIAWNRGPLAPLAGAPLEDPRVELLEGDVLAAARAPKARFDAILLDVDNGPVALTVRSNQALYAKEGIAAFRAALTDGGVLVVWSAHDDAAFADRLRQGGFQVEVRRVASRGAAGGRAHVLFVARRRPVR